jgi:hypothetical protein
MGSNFQIGQAMNSQLKFMQGKNAIFECIPAKNFCLGKHPGLLEINKYELRFILGYSKSTSGV